MRIRIAVPMIALALSACRDAPEPLDPAPDARAPAAFKGPEIIPGRFIVTLRGDATPSAVASEHEVRPDFVYHRVLTGFAGRISDAARSGLLRDARVVRVEPDGVVRAASTQSNPGWGLDRIDQRALPLDGGYTYLPNGSGVSAYVIDTGIRPTHVDFGGRASIGYDAVGDGQNGADCNGHGTHVAGTIGGATYGVAKGVSLIGVRVLDCSGSGTWSGVIAGIDWVAANRTGPAVANLSISGWANASADDAVRRLIAAGVSTVVAAGNNGADACGYSPARVPEAITVGATDEVDARASSSNHGDCLDWFAPGVNITSASYTSDTAASASSGTSMAAPHSAGVAALYLQGNTAASATTVREAILGFASKSVVSSAATANNHLLYSRVDEVANTAPVASFTATCSGVACSFTDRSTDADGSPASWSWDFGDGSISTAQHPAHRFMTSGTYTVKLVVKDDRAATASITKTLTVSAIVNLSARGYKVKGLPRVDLTWSGATTANVDVWRNGAKVTSTPNDGAHTDSPNSKGGGTYTYRVCEAGTSVCSSDASASF